MKKLLPILLVLLLASCGGRPAGGEELFLSLAAPVTLTGELSGDLYSGMAVFDYYSSDSSRLSFSEPRSVAGLTMTIEGDWAAIEFEGLRKEMLRDRLPERNPLSALHGLLSSIEADGRSGAGVFSKSDEGEGLAAFSDAAGNRVLLREGRVIEISIPAAALSFVVAS